MVDRVLGGDRSDCATFCPLRTVTACRRTDGRDGLGAGPRGHALIDRALYLPKSWAEDPNAAPTPEPLHKREFATKPALARQLIDRAVDAKIPAAWVAGDEVCGADPRLRAAIRGHHLGYVLAVAANRHVPTRAGRIRVDRLPAMLPRRAPTPVTTIC